MINLIKSLFKPKWCHCVHLKFKKMDIRTSGESRVIGVRELDAIEALYNSFYESGECDG